MNVLLRFFILLLIFQVPALAISGSRGVRSGKAQYAQEPVLLHPAVGTSREDFFRYLDALGYERLADIFAQHEEEYAHLRANTYVQRLEDLLARWIYHQRNYLLLCQAIWRRFYPHLDMRASMDVWIKHDHSKFNFEPTFMMFASVADLISHPHFSLALGYGRVWDGRLREIANRINRIDERNAVEEVARHSELWDEKTQILSEAGIATLGTDHVADVVDRFKGGELKREEYGGKFYPLEHEFHRQPELLEQAKWAAAHYVSIVGKPEVFLEIRGMVREYFDQRRTIDSMRVSQISACKAALGYDSSARH